MAIEHAVDGSSSDGDKKKRRLPSLRQALIDVGRNHDGTYAWHRTSDAYFILIAELLLKRTKRVVVGRVFDTFIEAYPSPGHLAAADPDELYDRVRPVGLARRTKRLPQVGAAIVAAGGVPSSRSGLLLLPEVGAYVADATRLYAFSEPCFPWTAMRSGSFVDRLTGAVPIDRWIPTGMPMCSMP